ncbi:MAG: ParA family protein [Anaerolineales bacterium]|nr:ParA family protein [Anaerolineales bacterium]MCA9975566.1 ParA family protein [Anaerolineales bacterium]MCB8965849.1 ParA family protein [Ardenticatenaceae bacterium]
MTRIIAIANQKGGTGKTTTAINLAAGLVRANPRHRVMLADIDPQANGTAVFLGVPFAAGPRLDGVNTMYEVILDQVAAAQALQTVTLLEGNGETAVGKMHILPSHLDLASAELELVNLFERERRLRHALAPIVNQYDFIIIDCPPSLGLLTVNALMTANEVLIPVDPGLFPLIGLNLLNRTIEMVRQANPSLAISGVVPTLVDRTALARDTQQELAATFGSRLLPAIPRRVAFGEAHAAGQDIFAYDLSSDSASAYADLVKEIMRRG